MFWRFIYGTAYITFILHLLFCKRPRRRSNENIIIYLGHLLISISKFICTLKKVKHFQIYIFLLDFLIRKSKMFNINFFKEISHTFPTKQYVNGCLQLTFFNFQKLHKIPKIRLVKGFAGLSILNNFLISMTMTLFVGVRIPIPQPV